MLKILFILSSFFLIPADCPEMNKVRDSYGNIRTETQLLAFIELIEHIPCEETEPYMASAIMQKAQFAFAPWSKYRYFMKGKGLLEKYIQSNPENVDARYIRFIIQVHVPFFLGYNKEIDEDVSFIKENLDSTSISESYKAQILQTIEKFYKK